jgi:hypothetical protein
MKKLTRFYIVIVLAIALAQLTSCATQNKSLALGGAVGFGTGAIIGGIADPGKDGQYRTRNIIIGSAIGGMAGMATGAFIHSNMEDKKRNAYEQGKTDATNKLKESGSMPNLKNPKVEARWIEAKAIGNRYVDGHFEYVITEQARWEER